MESNDKTLKKIGRETKILEDQEDKLTAEFPISEPSSEPATLEEATEILVYQGKMVKRIVEQMVSPVIEYQTETSAALRSLESKVRAIEDDQTDFKQQVQLTLDQIKQAQDVALANMQQDIIKALKPRPLTQLQIDVLTKLNKYLDQYT